MIFFAYTRRNFAGMVISTFYWDGLVQFSYTSSIWGGQHILSGIDTACIVHWPVYPLSINLHIQQLLCNRPINRIFCTFCPFYQFRSIQSSNSGESARLAAKSRSRSPKFKRMVAGESKKYALNVQDLLNDIESAEAIMWILWELLAWPKTLHGLGGFVS